MKKREMIEQGRQYFFEVFLLFFTVICIFSASGVHSQAASSLKACTMKSAENQNGSVQIKWTKIKKATGYEIYRKKESGSYKKIATINDNTVGSYTDTTVKNGNTYRYKVRAFNKNTQAAYSDVIKIKYIKPVTIKSASVSNKSVTLKWTSVSGASSYKIYRQTSGGSYELLKKVGKSKNTWEDTSVSYGHSYTYKICACTTNFDSTGAVVSCDVLASIENITDYYAIEADVILNGSGSGYHAKLVIVAPDSAVSFGIEYDKGATAPYTGKAFFLVENIHSNKSGGQEYHRVKEASLGTSYRLLITLSSKGVCNMYVNGLLVESVTNTEINSQEIYLRVEGAAKVNGDYVNASFSNIKLKYGRYNASKIWYPHDIRSPEDSSSIGIYSDVTQFAANSKVTIKGTLRGLSSGDDWDSAYNSVSGGVTFTNYKN